MNLKELVGKDNKVRFVFYRDGVLWYEVYQVHAKSPYSGITPIVATNFRFPVPVADCGNGTFLAEDRAILYMRYIRKQLEVAKKEQEELEEYIQQQKCCGGDCKQ